MTPVGKVAWFWNAYNERTLEALARLPQDSYRVVRIEDLDYQKYRELARFLGIDAKMTEVDFDALRMSRPHAFWRKRTVDSWSAQEIAEYESQVAELAKRFDYRYRIAQLVDEASAEKPESGRLRRIGRPNRV